MAQPLKKTIVSEKPLTRFKDVVGLEEEKKILKQAIVLPITQPHIFNEDRPKLNGFLMYGVS